MAFLEGELDDKQEDMNGRKEYRTISSNAYLSRENEVKDGNAALRIGNAAVRMVDSNGGKYTPCVCFVPFLSHSLTVKDLVVLLDSWL